MVLVSESFQSNWTKILVCSNIVGALFLKLTTVGASLEKSASGVRMLSAVRCLKGLAFLSCGVE